MTAKKPLKPKRPPISLEEAARRLGLDGVCKNPAKVVRGMARRGELVYITAGKFTLIDPDSIDDLLGGAAIETKADAAQAGQ